MGRNLVIRTYWSKLVFGVVFLLTYPIQLILVQKNKTHELGHKLNIFLVKCVFFFTGIRVEINSKYNPKEDKKYIFISNHSSYLDIPSFFYLQRKHIKFVGKISLEKIPLFGYMFKRLYLSVDRRNKESRARVLQECRKALKNDKSVAIYPEGAIPHQTPQMIHFKDGAFRLSIEENVPIVPITLPFNHKILPVDSSFLQSRDMKIIIHEPLNTPKDPIKDVQKLKEKSYQVIENELKKHGVI